MIEIDRYEHFSFDLWMTIIKSNPQFKPKRTQLLKDIFSLNKGTEEIDAVIRHYDNLFNTISEKTGNHIEREEVFLLILNDLGVNVRDLSMKELDLFFEKSDELFVENVPLIIWKDVHVFLDNIKAEGKTASILSNTAFIHGSSIRKVLEMLDLEKYFSFMIFSDEIGVSKPNFEIFEYLYKNTKQLKTITKSQILHIGDNPVADYQGAISFGIGAELVKFN